MSTKPVGERARAHPGWPEKSAEPRALSRPRFILLLYLNPACLAMRKSGTTYPTRRTTGSERFS